MKTQFSVLILLVLLFTTCKPLVDKIPEERSCEFYGNPNAPQGENKDTVTVMTWNIRFGCGSEILWFGDACGSRTVLRKLEVSSSLDRIIEVINSIKPDILLLQEVDIKCKRTAYLDQMKYIIDRTYFGYGYYATVWNSQFIPSDGLGKINEGNAILSIWPLSDGELYPLPLRNDLDALTKYFYVRETAMSAIATMPNGKSFYAVNIHLSAFSTDDTKYRQLLRYIDICDSLSSTGLPMVTGGDFNLLPPNADKTDYCDIDACEGEHFHGVGDDPLHKEGSNYLPEITWMNNMYDKYEPSLSLEDYKLNQHDYFTHTTNPNIFWERTLDYLFANSPFIANSHKAWQELRIHSDHAPVTALWSLKN